ncbi:MAG: hypothetical protein HQM10_10245 [Candidatus Riflebacteria bacterium]|nr:hypothetical protein [Candidatus Riflebacteria bacterium]
MEQAELKRPGGFFELSVIFFLLKGTNNLLLVLLASVFLKSYGAEELPLFYVVFNAVYIISQMLILKNPQWKGHAFLAKLAYPLILLCFASSLTATGSKYFMLFMFLFISVYDLHSTQAFAEMAGEILPIREMKRLITRIHAAGTAGSILSGLFLKYLLEMTGISLTFFLLCFFFILSKKLLNDILPFLEKCAQNSKNPSSNLSTTITADKATDTDATTATSSIFPSTNDLNAGNTRTSLASVTPAPELNSGAEFDTITSSADKTNTIDTTNTSNVASTSNTANATNTPNASVNSATSIFSGTSTGFKYYSFILIVFSFLGIFCRIIVEFLFRGVVSSHFTSVEEMASFMGIFGAGIDLSAFIAQGFLGQYIFSEFRLSTILSVRTLALVPLSLAAFLSPGIILVSSVQFCLMSLTKILIIPAFVILLEPLQSGAKFMLRKFIGIGDSLANLSAGIFLIVLKFYGIGADPVLFLPVMIIFFSLVFFIIAIDRLYPLMVKETLAVSPADSDFEVVKALRHVPKTDRIVQINSLLASPNPTIRFRAIHEAGELDSDMCVDMLLTAIINETDLKNIGAVVRIIFHKTGHHGLDILSEFLDESVEPRLVADIIEVYSQLPHSSADSILEPFLENAHHRVRGNAVLAILRTSNDSRLLQKALETLKIMITSSNYNEQSAAVIVMKLLKNQVFVSALSWLADSPEKEIRERAMEALADMATSGAIEVLSNIQKLNDNRAAIAEKLLCEIAEKSDSTVKKAFLSLSDQERAEVGVWLKTAPQNLDLDLLGKILFLKNKNIRRQIVESISGEKSESKTAFLAETLSFNGKETFIDQSVAAKYLQNEKGFGIPFFVDLIPAIFGPHNSVYDHFLEAKLSDLILHAAVMARACELNLNGEIEFQNAEKHFSKWMRNLLHLSAMTASEPAEALEAIKKSCVDDGFLHSIAFELIEERLEKQLAVLILPLLDWKKESAQLYNISREKSGQDVQKFSASEILAFWNKSGHLSRLADDLLAMEAQRR